MIFITSPGAKKLATGHVPQYHAGITKLLSATRKHEMSLIKIKRSYKNYYNIRTIPAILGFETRTPK